jgi:hypothetical protein
LACQVRKALLPKPSEMTHDLRTSRRARRHRGRDRVRPHVRRRHQHAQNRRGVRQHHLPWTGWRRSATYGGASTRAKWSSYSSTRTTGAGASPPCSGRSLETSPAVAAGRPCDTAPNGVLRAICGRGRSAGSFPIRFGHLALTPNRSATSGPERALARTLVR